MSGRPNSYVPWTRQEMDKLETAWETGGMRAAREALPHRSKNSLRGKAESLNLKLFGRKPLERIPDSELEWIDAALRREYRDGRPDLVRLSLELKRSRSALKSRACLLGLARPAGHNGLEWSDEEDRLLAECLDSGLAIRTVYKRFALAGHKRSIAAIASRVSRGGIGWQRNFMVVTEVANMFGVEEKTVRRWLGSGALKSRRAPGPSSVREVDESEKTWQIRAGDLREFMLGHPERWDHRRMQQQILLDLLCGADFNRLARKESTA